MAFQKVPPSQNIRPLAFIHLLASGTTSFSIYYCAEFLKAKTPSIFKLDSNQNKKGHQTMETVFGSESQYPLSRFFNFIHLYW